MIRKKSFAGGLVLRILGGSGTRQKCLTENGVAKRNYPDGGSSLFHVCYGVIIKSTLVSITGQLRNAILSVPSNFGGTDAKVVLHVLTTTCSNSEPDRK